MKNFHVICLHRYANFVPRSASTLKIKLVNEKRKRVYIVKFFVKFCARQRLHPQRHSQRHSQHHSQHHSQSLPSTLAPSTLALNVCLQRLPQTIAEQSLEVAMRRSNVTPNVTPNATPNATPNGTPNATPNGNATPIVEALRRLRSNLWKSLCDVPTSKLSTSKLSRIELLTYIPFSFLNLLKILLVKLRLAVQSLHICVDISRENS